MAESAFKFCQHCGAKIDRNAELCPQCGVRVSGVASHKHKNPGLAAVLSLFMIGLGQIYNGQIGKGLLFMVFGFCIALSILFLVGLILFPAFWIYNIYDAYATAQQINEGQEF